MAGRYRKSIPDEVKKFDAVESDEKKDDALKLPSLRDFDDDSSESDIVYRSVALDVMAPFVTDFPETMFPGLLGIYGKSLTVSSPSEDYTEFSVEEESVNLSPVVDEMSWWKLHFMLENPFFHESVSKRDLVLPPVPKVIEFHTSLAYPKSSVSDFLESFLLVFRKFEAERNFDVFSQVYLNGKSLNEILEEKSLSSYLDSIASLCIRGTVNRSGITFGFRINMYRFNADSGSSSGILAEFQHRSGSFEEFSDFFDAFVSYLPDSVRLFDSERNLVEPCVSPKLTVPVDPSIGTGISTGGIKLLLGRVFDIQDVTLESLSFSLRIFRELCKSEGNVKILVTEFLSQMLEFIKKCLSTLCAAQRFREKADVSLVDEHLKLIGDCLVLLSGFYPVRGVLAEREICENIIFLVQGCRSRPDLLERVAQFLKNVSDTHFSSLRSAFEESSPAYNFLLVHRHSKNTTTRDCIMTVLRKCGFQRESYSATGSSFVTSF